MGRKKNKGYGYGAGTYLSTGMILSEAFINLGKSGTSPKVSYASKNILLMLLAKREFKKIPDRNGNKVMSRVDDNKFVLTYKELEHFGISNKNATRGIDELLAKGFISIVDPGGMFEQHKAVYALEEDYLRWNSNDKQVIRIRKRDVLRGYQKRKTNIADVYDGHPHRRLRQSPPTEDTDVYDGHPLNSELEDTEGETTWG